MAETRLNRFIYNHSPVFIQNLMTSIYGWQKNRYRYGSPLARRWLEFYRETAKWPEQRLREYQLEQMRRTIAYAYKHVPFYRERFDSCGLKPEHIKTVEDLRQLPYLTRDDVRAAGTRLISDEYKVKDLFTTLTSGSTGMPLILYSSREAVIRNFVFSWAQCRSGMPRGKYRYANFTGLEIVRPKQKKPPYWRMNYAGNQRLYSVFHISERTIPYYLEDMVKFRPVWFYGHAASLYLLSDYILRTGYDYPCPPKAVVTGAGECLPMYREAIEKAFKTRVWDEYGQGEMVGLAFECECGKLHEKIEYGLMEFLPAKETTGGLKVYELICTSLINDARPLIRYRVGDLAVIDPDAKCPLGRPGRVIEQIYGRTANFLIAGDGSRISNISVMAKKCRNIRALQAVQKEIGQVTLRVVPQPEYNVQTDEPFMIKQFRKKMGDESRMKIDVEYVDKIELTSAGKFLSIVSKL